MKRPPVTLTLVVIALLNLSLGFSPRATTRNFLPQPDFVVFCALTAWASLARPRLANVFYAVAGGVHGLLFLFKGVDRLYPEFFGRRLVLYRDIFHIRNLWDLLVDSYAPVVVALIVGVTLLFVAAVWLGFAIAYRILGRGLRSRWAAIGLTLGAILFLVFPRVWVGPNHAYAHHLGAFSHARKICGQLARIGSSKDRQREYQDMLDAEQRKRTASGRNLEGLHDADFYVVFVESYGAALWTHGGHRDRFRPFAEEFTRRLAEQGIETVSGFATSPVKGGGSWLAHSALLAGVPVRSNGEFVQLLASNLKPLPAYFNDLGHHTMSVLPAVDVDWPEGRYFQYAEKLDLRDFDWTGPTFGFSPIPDQFVMTRLLRDVVSRAERPLFVEVVLTSSHPPFRIVPRYLESPGAALDPARYRESEALRFDNSYVHYREGEAGYVASMTYVWRVLGDFLSGNPRDRFVLAVLGDHQPVPMIPGADSNDVPVHFFSRDSELLAPLRSRGFAAGFRPPPGGSPLPFSRFLDLLLSVYDDGHAKTG